METINNCADSFKSSMHSEAHWLLILKHENSKRISGSRIFHLSKTFAKIKWHSDWPLNLKTIFYHKSCFIEPVIIQIFSN